MPPVSKIKLASALLAIALAPAYAGAQEEDDPNVSVQDRGRPEFDPLGVRSGSFLIFPEVDLGVAYDTNIFANADDEQDDLIFSVQPQATAVSQWSRHSLAATVDADAAAYLDNTDNNFVSFGAALDGRLDIRRDQRLFGQLSLGRQTESFESPDNVDEDEVTNVLVGAAAVRYRQNFNRIFVQPGVRLAREDFEDSDNNFRDRNRYIAALRGGYELSPNLAVFGEADYRIVQYDNDDVGLDRDSTGFAARVGAELALTGLLFGEIAVGYTQEEFDDDALDDAAGPSAQGVLTYNATPLTSLVGTLQAEIEPTTVGFEGDIASSQFRTGLQLDVFHELRRNVLISGLIGVANDDFEGTERSDQTYEVGAGAEYSLNRNLALSGNWRFSTRTSDDEDSEFDRNIFFVGVNARL